MFFSDWRCTHLSEEVSVNTITRVRVGMCCKQKFISEIYSKRLASKIYPICTRHITFLLFQQVAQISHVHFKLFVSEVQQEADNSGRIKILPSGFRLNTYCSIWKSLLVEPRWAPLAISLVTSSSLRAKASRPPDIVYSWSRVTAINLLSSEQKWCIMIMIYHFNTCFNFIFPICRKKHLYKLII